MTLLNGRMNAKKDYVKPEQVIVNELIQALESGNTKLWRKEWSVKGGFRNVLSGHEYKGSNPAYSVYRVLLGVGIYHSL